MGLRFFNLECLHFPIRDKKGQESKFPDQTLEKKGAKPNTSFQSDPCRSSQFLNTKTSLNLTSTLHFCPPGSSNLSSVGNLLPLPGFCKSVLIYVPQTIFLSTSSSSLQSLWSCNLNSWKPMALYRYPAALHVCIPACSNCVRLWDAMNCSLPGSSVHGILQAGILEWVAMTSRASSLPWDQTHVSSYLPCIGRSVLYH